jgi:putative copper resistance protein D
VSFRLPRLALAAWAAAALVVVGLAVAVAHYLSGGGHAMHAGEALTRGGTSGPTAPLFGTPLVTAWQLDAIAVAVLVLAAAAYLTGVALVPVRDPGARWPAARTAAFLAGLAVCAYATNGSIAVYDKALFTAHMAGHLALVMVAPVLLVAGRPLRLALAAAAPQRRVRIERVARGPVISFLTAPPVALASYAAVIVGSHLTGLMDTIMRDTWAGQVEHLVYLVVGCQFFALVVGDQPLRWRLGAPTRWLLLAVAMAVDTFTGIVLLQGTRAVQMVAAPGVHVDALADTRAGGAIMWFGGDGIMAVVMITLVVAWLREADARRGDGWLERARQEAFVNKTGAQPAASGELDDDEAARESYNAWLARLHQEH